MTKLRIQFVQKAVNLISCTRDMCVYKRSACGGTNFTHSLAVLIMNAVFAVHRMQFSAVVVCVILFSVSFAGFIPI